MLKKEGGERRLVVSAGVLEGGSCVCLNTGWVVCGCGGVWFAGGGFKFVVMLIADVLVVFAQGVLRRWG
jgi:hypothetical protein